MQFRVTVVVPELEEQELVMVDGLDVGELASCIVEVPTEDYHNDIEKATQQVIDAGLEYINEIVILRIVKVE